MSHYEIEVKSLLGEKEYADALREKMCANDPACSCVSTNKQLNHYFEGGDVQELFEKTKDLFEKDEQEKLKHVIEKGTSFSIRSRQKNDDVLLVVKASVDAGSSENTVSRLEFEEKVDLTLDELDARLREAGFTYQAKWSREREEYVYKGTNVTIDKNAGYGYLAEFERLTEAENMLDAARKEIDAVMAELGVVELPQDRLERMFKHYNENWDQYYGTDKTFVIE